MPTYEYRCKTTGVIFEARHSMFDDDLTEWDNPQTGQKEPCEKLISAPALDLDNPDLRGYKGKFRDLIRPKGSPVDAPVSKSEADRAFQAYVDSGGLAGIKPTMDINKMAANDPNRPRELDELVNRSSKNE